MPKSELIDNLHLYAKKDPKGYQPYIASIATGKTVALKKVFETQEECVAFLKRNLKEIKEEHF